MKRALLLLLGVLLALAPLDATAASAKAKARAAVKAAGQAFRAKQFERAAEKYIEAYDILVAAKQKQKPALLYNAGLAYEQATQCARAVVYFERYADALDGRISADAASRLSRARRCAPEVAIQTTPPGADVEIDGAPRGRSPLTTNLAAGGHRLVLRLEGYVMVERNIAIEAGRPKAIAEILSAIERPTQLRIQVERAADVHLDDRALGTGPFDITETVAPGAHVVTVRESSCRPRSQTTDVLAGTTKSITFDATCAPESSPPRSPVGVVTTPEPEGGGHALEWIVGAAGVGALVAGGVFVALSLDARSDVEKLLEVPEAERDGGPIRERNADVRRHNIIAAVALSAGAVAIGTAVVLLLTGDDAGDVAAYVGPRGAGLVVDW